MKFGRNDGINWQQITHPNPRHAAKCDFKAATPINAERVRIGSLPGIELFFDFADVFLIAGESACPGESDQMLMPVALAGDAVASAFGENQNVIGVLGL